MNLGLEGLTDDQLVSLLQEVLQECASRDPIIRKIGQGKIDDEAEMLKLKREAMKHAYDLARRDYLKGLGKELKAAFKKDALNGKIQLVTAAEEAEVVNAAARKAVSEAKQELKEKISKDTESEIRSKILSGEMEVWSEAEKEAMIKDATESAVQWMKNEAHIPLNQFAAARLKIYQNLLRMGHSKEDVDKIYGHP